MAASNTDRQLKEIPLLVIDDVFHLKNSEAKHRPAGGVRSAYGSAERERLEKQRGNWSSSGQRRVQGIERWLLSIVTFAEHACRSGWFDSLGHSRRRTTDGEVRKRCDTQWIRQTAEGLEAILAFRQVKYRVPHSAPPRFDELAGADSLSRKAAIARARQEGPASRILLCQHDHTDL